MTLLYDYCQLRLYCTVRHCWSWYNDESDQDQRLQWWISAKNIRVTKNTTFNRKYGRLEFALQYKTIILISDTVFFTLANLICYLAGREIVMLTDTDKRLNWFGFGGGFRDEG